MNINIGEYYEAKLRRFVELGVASNKTEALRMAVSSYEKQLEEEETKMVLERIAEDELRLAQTKSKYISLDELLKKHHIDKNKP